MAVTKRTSFYFVTGTKTHVARFPFDREKSIGKLVALLCLEYDNLMELLENDFTVIEDGRTRIVVIEHIRSDKYG